MFSFLKKRKKKSKNKHEESAPATSASKKTGPQPWPTPPMRDEEKQPERPSEQANYNPLASSRVVDGRSRERSSRPSAASVVEEKDQHIPDVKPPKSVKDLQKPRFAKRFKPDSHRTNIIIWGLAHPLKLFPNYVRQSSPFKHEDLSRREFVKLAAARDAFHCFGITRNGLVFAFGEADLAALGSECNPMGLGSKTFKTTSFPLRTLQRQKHFAVDIATSSRHTIILTRSGEVFGCGDGELTCLGRHTNEAESLDLVNRATGGAVEGLSCSSSHSAVYWHDKNDQKRPRIFMFGKPGPWLGLGDDAETYCGEVELNFGSEDVPLGTRIVQIECGNEYTMIVLSSGYVMTCGVNYDGRMGDPQINPSISYPVIIPELPQCYQVSVGLNHTAFVTANGRVYTCGSGGGNKLGQPNDTREILEPRLVDVLEENVISRVICGTTRTYFLTEFGAVLVCGQDEQQEQEYPSPFSLEFVRPWRTYDIACAADFSVALGVKNKGELVAGPILSVDLPSKQIGRKAVASTVRELTNFSRPEDGSVNVLPDCTFVQTVKYVREDGNADQRPNNIPPPPVHTDQFGFEASGPALPPNFNEMVGHEFGHGHTYVNGKRSSVIEEAERPVRRHQRQ